MLRTADDVLAFWFGASPAPPSTRPYIEANWPRWFAGADARFDVAQSASAALVHAAGRGELDDAWGGDARADGVLARILLVDQFARCAFRGTRGAFAYDAKGAALAAVAAERGHFDAYSPVERFFVTLPLQHAEDAGLQRLGLELAARVPEGCADAAVAAWFEVEQRAAGYPHEHADVVARFGRFPHRNALLGRESTAAEAAWLASDAPPKWARSQSRATLHYWDGRGMGDVVRFLLEWAGAPYDEAPVRTRAAFDALRGGARAPLFGQVPMLELDGARVTQTAAIARFVARRHGLAAADCEREATRADELLHGVLDARWPLITARFGDEPDRALEQFGAAALPRLLDAAARALAEYGGEGREGADLFVAGGARATYADVALLELVCYARDELGDARVDGALATRPRVARLVAALAEQPRIAAFLASERRKPAPDDAFVAEVCEILAMPPPARLRES